MEYTGYENDSTEDIQHDLATEYAEPHYQDIIEDLEELAENPLNINTVTSFDLSRLHILNEIQINIRR